MLLLVLWAVGDSLEAVIVVDVFSSRVCFLTESSGTCGLWPARVTWIYVAVLLSGGIISLRIVRSIGVVILICHGLA